MRAVRAGAGRWGAGVMRGRRLRGVPVAVLPALLVAGCGVGVGDGERICTLIGGYSGVSFDWDPADFTDRVREESGYLRMRACADGVCQEREIAKRDPEPWPRSFVKLDDGVGAVTVPVRFTVTSGERVLFDERAEVRLSKGQPNGEHCPPTVYQGRVGVDPERGLSPQDAKTRDTKTQGAKAQGLKTQGVKESGSA